jgi:succinate-semialdehyde dehydrogenase/glutarate-semialdehyde dehydrogenase
MKSINPHTNKPIKEYVEYDEGQIFDEITKLHQGYLVWRHKSFHERKEVLLKIKQKLLDNTENLARLMSLEMGKPYTQSKAEIDKCAWVCEYYAENAESFLQSEIIETENTESYVRYEPLGVLFLIMPWNFPLWQVFRVAAPQLMLGNTIALKHASNVTGVALALNEIFTVENQAASLFHSLVIGVNKVPLVISHKEIRGVSLTGSERAGSEVAKLAGKALKPSLLELGGSDAYLILDNADIEHAAKTCVESRMINNGQSCIAAKRFIVTQKNKIAFESLVIKYMSEYENADPLLETTKLGPLARVDLKEELHQLVLKSIEEGASLILGEKSIDNESAHYPPTVLSNVTESMSAFKEELFGPVATIIEAKDNEDALRLANLSRFGLGGAVFSNDIEEARHFAHLMETGTVAINSYVKSDPRLPFGGIKDSGYGRELSDHNLRSFCNIKTITIS